MNLSLKHCFFLLLILSLFAGCKKEKENNSCDGKVCRPNQVCISGRCEEQADPTKDPNGNQIPPTKVFINKIKILKFPTWTLNGDDWDENSTPDLYLTIYQGSALVWRIPQVIENAQRMLQHEIVIDPPIEITKIRSNHSIQLYDDDGMLVDQFMGGVVFKPYSDTIGLSPKLTANTGGVVSYWLYVSYEL